MVFKGLFDLCIERECMCAYISYIYIHIHGHSVNELKEEINSCFQLLCISYVSEEKVAGEKRLK